MKRVMAIGAGIALALAVSLPTRAPYAAAQDKPAGAQAKQSDPFAGTWKLNLAKSKYNGGAPPKSELRTYLPGSTKRRPGSPSLEAQGDSETLTVHGIAADGSPVEWGYTVRFDGKYYPITGAGPGGADAIAVKRINARTVEATLAKGGKAIQTASRVVSDDGKTMTATARIVGAGGPPLFVIVYDKQ